ncbi:hypothetical protein [Streptomyces alanosinicus]|uniref:Uncharacterized protein n=1 Tax=Streptomyces alanosinicus TaxID=68171 RepID=A0A918YSF3_9ACTN|nr:hypothetical protein [Streptomyces alanosinicus]GHE14150.1 hypothetical protein GCM10010339_83740 [Streptomyces alanosinicus]
MHFAEQLTLALNSRSSSGDRPDPEQFLDEFFSKIGIARGAADCGAARKGRCTQSAGAEEDDQEAWLAPPTAEDLLDELRGLLPAAAAEKEREKEKGGVYRRIAEIVEQVDDETAAFVWWLHAAHAGDEVAVAIVDELALDLSAERPSVPQSIHRLQNTTR